MKMLPGGVHIVSDIKVPSRTFLPAFLASYIDLLFPSLCDKCNTIQDEQKPEFNDAKCCVWSMRLQAPLAAILSRNWMKLGTSVLKFVALC